MKLVAALAVVLLALVSPADAGEEPHFSYSGETGPANWGRLAGDWERCGVGARQSPVDLDAAVPATLEPLSFGYRRTEVEATDTGHTITFAPKAKNVLRLGGVYAGTLLQLHFHARSEHHIGDRSYPLEFHFVHSHPEGRLTVVGVFVRAGAANPGAAALTRSLPAEETGPITLSLDPRLLLPASHRSVRYAGSLTTPPCTEDVRWIVLTTPVTFSARQIALLRKRYAHNNRPLQPLFGRTLHVTR